MHHHAAVTAPSVLAAVTARLPDALSLLETLVNMDTSSRAAAALAEAGRWIESQLRALDFDVERHDRPSHGPVLIGRSSGRGRHRVLLLAHYDTVFEPGEPSRRPFTVRGARAYGPGVADMKGGVITLWEVLRFLRAAGWDGYRTLTVIHNPDEETGSETSRSLIELEGRSADYCLVFEPGRPDGSIVTARKGIAHFTLTVTGRAAHAGVAPQEGASAVLALARKIVAIHALNDYARGLTLNTIVTRGGTRANVVPDEAVSQIDMRTPTMIAGQEAVARLQAIAAAHDVPGTHAVLTGGIDRPPFEPGPGGAVLLSLARAHARSLGFTLKDTTTGGGSDGNLIAALGVPVLDGLGAVGGAFHSPDEYLETGTIPPRAALAALLMVEACGRDDLLRPAGSAGPQS
jgi:glutamate carboxypeptidase